MRASGSNSARLNGPDKGQDQFRTRQIDLSDAVNVEVSYYLQRELIPVTFRIGEIFSQPGRQGVQPMQSWLAY